MNEEQLDQKQERELADQKHDEAGEAARAGISFRAIADIDASPTNPRKYFDEAQLTELAASISEHGVLQPVTARPSPSGDGRLELVIGERRLRASKLAGLEEVPVIIRELADDQVLEVQLIENDQRSDVTALEEADALVELAHRFGRSVEYLADRLGRPEDFVRRRLKLGNLMDPLRELLDADRIGIGSAELLADLDLEFQQRLADGKLSLDERDRWDEDKPRTWSSTDVRNAIRGEATWMKGAWWDLDAWMGDIGPCSTCLKRSSAQPDLLDMFLNGRELADDDDDHCLDPDCWSSKRSIWLDAQREAGVEVLEEDAAKSATKHRSNYKPGQYIREDAGLYHEGAYRSWGELAPNVDRAIALDEWGNLKRVMAFDDVVADLEARDEDELLDRLRPSSKGEGEDPAAAARKKAAKLREQMGQVVKAATSAKAKGMAAQWDRVLFDAFLSELNQDRLTEVCKRRGIDIPPASEAGYGSQRFHQAMLPIINAAPDSERFGLLVELALVGRSLASRYGSTDPIWDTALQLGELDGPLWSPDEDTGVSTQVANAAKVHGITTCRDVVEYLADRAAHIDAAHGRLCKLKGIGPTGATQIMERVVAVTGWVGWDDLLEDDPRRPDLIERWEAATGRSASSDLAGGTQAR